MEDLKPKIRAVEVFPAVIDGKEMIVLRDPLDLIPQTIFLSPESFFIFSLMDGTRSIDDLRMEFFKKKGVLPSSDEIFLLVKQLSGFGVLEDENFSSILKARAEGLLKSGKRNPICAGSSYPSTAENLTEFLKEIWKMDVPERKKEPDLLISPHLDINISREAYAHSYKNLNLNDKETIVIFGVSHYGLSKPLSVFPLPFETPFGEVPVNKDLTEKFIQSFGMPEDFDLISHSREHSIELQLIFLQYFLKKKFYILPILVDSSKGSFDVYLDFLNDLTQRDDIFFIAGIDLSHIGPRYGDNFPATKEYMDKIKEEEKYLLDLVLKKDKENFEIFEREKSSVLRICGIGILKLLLNFPISDGNIRCHHSGFMQALASAVNCISMDLYF